MHQNTFLTTPDVQKYLFLKKVSGVLEECANASKHAFNHTRWFFDILACISASYLRLTTAHTQAKKKQLLQQYPPSPPQGGDRFDLCVFIGYKY
jgi:hypothetical protein